MHDFLWRSKVSISEMMSKIEYSHRILSLGSCFSVEIADKLKNLQYQIIQNPAGITFNPISLLSTIKSVVLANPLPESALENVNDIWSHPDFHGSFNSISKSEILLRINESITSAHLFLKEVDVVFITIGTAYVFEQKADQKVVNNCHKKPADHFERKKLSPEKISTALNEIKSLIDNFSRKEVRYIITLSPVRHLRDGIIENQLSKSTCLLAIHDFVNQHDSCHYFPSYEIMLDDLRDYRFYNEDLIHPSELALKYIYQKFEKFALSPKEEALRKKVSKINTSLNHRPINPDSENHKIFVKKLDEEIVYLKKRFDWMKF